MEITLEKIELVKDRTGVSYKEAKEALEAADGSVVDAIINIEETVGFDRPDSSGDNTNAVLKTIKETIAKGNVSRIIVRKGKNVILNLPLTAGVVGAVIAPWGVIIGALAAAGTGCNIEFQNDRGELTDINGKVKKQYGKARAYGQKYYDKGVETVDRIRDSELYSDLKDRSQNVIGDIKGRSQDVLDDLKDRTANGIDTEKVKGTIEDLKAKSEEFKAKSTDFFHRNDDAEEEFFEESDVDAEPESTSDAEAVQEPAETEAPEEAAADDAAEETEAPAADAAGDAVKEEEAAAEENSDAPATEA